MRCSERDAGSMFMFLTSTPLDRNRKRVRFGENATFLSPILESNKVGLGPSTRQSDARKGLFPTPSANSICGNSTLQKRSIPPMVIVYSDSEDEDMKTSSTQINPILSSRKKLSTAENVKTTRSKKREGQSKQQPSFLEEISNGSKKGSRRISRVEAIFDEIVKETLGKSIQDIRVKSDESIDNMIEKVMKNRCIEVHRSSEPPTRAKRQKKPSTQVANDKENVVRKIGPEVEILLVNKKKGNESPKGISRTRKQSRLVAQENNIIEPNDNVGKISENTPAAEESNKEKSKGIINISGLDWHIMNNQSGVKYKDSFFKVDPKCTFLNPNKYKNTNQLFIVIMGNGSVTIDHNTRKVGPGDIIDVPRGVEILNTGVKKDLILRYF